MDQLGNENYDHLDFYLGVFVVYKISDTTRFCLQIGNKLVWWLSGLVPKLGQTNPENLLNLLTFVIGYVLLVATISKGLV